MHFFLKILIVLVLLLWPAELAFGHGMGASFEKEDGEYVIDIGYEPEEFIEKETATFSFGLLNKETRDQVEFDDVWVRISKGNQTVFATGVGAGVNNNPTMLFEFPSDGDYTLHVRFQKDNETLSEADFPIKVLTSQDIEKKEEGFPLIPVVGGAVLGAGLILSAGLLKKKSSR